MSCLKKEFRKWFLAWNSCLNCIILTASCILNVSSQLYLVRQLHLMCQLYHPNCNSCLNCITYQQLTVSPQLQHVPQLHLRKVSLDSYIEDVHQLAKHFFPPGPNY
jgi:hypothetical protein